MDRGNVRERVLKVVGDMAPLGDVEVGVSSVLRVDLGYDSLSLLELAGALEDEFGLPASDEDETDVETVADVERFVLEAVERAGTEASG